MALSIATESQLLTTGPPDFKRKKLEDPNHAINMVIRQDPFQVTLDSFALLAMAIVLVIGMHVIEHLFLEFLIIGVPVLLLIRNDYLNFLKLGPGGTPPTLSGYARLMWYKLFALRDPFRPPPRDPSQLPAAGILRQALAYRPGPRPLVAGLAPQRQLNQHGCVHMYDQLRRSLEALAAAHPAKFVTGTSCIEKHGFALFARSPMNVYGNGEIVHIHTSDLSMHMNLHPDDIKEVLGKGFGQRHPMAWTGIVHTPIPSTFVMVYAPRDENDLRTLCKIIEAAIWYITAERVDIPVAGESRA